jgi:hypothetical protein
MTTITINDREIELHARPKHAAVVKVQNLMTEWLMSKIDTTNLDSSLSIEVALQQAVVVNPELMKAATEMQQTLELDQTIMLATNMECRALEKLKETMYEDEYIGLFEASCEAMGGSANDFFGIYYSGIHSMKQNGKRVFTKKSSSEISESQPNDS